MSGHNLMTRTTIVDTDRIIDVGRGIPERLPIYSKSKSITISIQKSLTVRSLIILVKQQHYSDDISPHPNKAAH